LIDLPVKSCYQLVSETNRKILLDNKTSHFFFLFSFLVATEIEIKEFMSNYENNVVKTKNQSSKQLLVIERTICEYDMNAVSDTMLSNYFDIKTQLTPEIDSRSLDELQKLKHEINETVWKRFY
jgi:hypothetical protein